jgi:NADH-quinone oxidoreductase subunit A
MADDPTLFRALLYIGSVLGIAGVLVLVSWLLGQKHKDKVTDEPYESGIAPTGSPRVPFNIDFYLVGLLFVIFDLEAAFLFAWAVAARKLGWEGYAGVSVFVGILVVGLIYEWRQGALDFGPKGRFQRTAGAANGAKDRVTLSPTGTLAPPPRPREARA